MPSALQLLIVLSLQFFLCSICFGGVCRGRGRGEANARIGGDVGRFLSAVERKVPKSFRQENKNEENKCTNSAMCTAGNTVVCGERVRRNFKGERSPCM